jgi:cytochrome c peroxidase/chitodextrinase
MAKQFNFTKSFLGALSLISVFVLLLSYQNFSTTSYAIGGNGHASSWDNRFTIVTQADEVAGSGNAKWLICLFKPEYTKLANPASGVDSFGRQIIAINDSYKNCITLMSIKTANSVYGYIPKINSDGSTDFNNYAARSVIFSMNALAISPVGEDPIANPFKSDLAGNASGSGNYLTYDFYLYTQVYHLSGRYNSETQNIPQYAFGAMRMKIVIENAMTTGAIIKNIKLVQDWQPIKIRNTNEFLTAIEPSITADGRFMIMQAFGSGSIAGSLNYSFNASPSNLSNWSAPASITKLYTDNSTINGQTLKSLYPLARKPIKANLGADYSPTDTVRGAYPWVSWEGTDIFFTATNSYQNAVRGGWSVVGESTGGQIRIIDGAFQNQADMFSNPSKTVVLFTSGIANTSSIWNPYKDLQSSNFPQTNDHPVGLFLHSNGMVASEVSFKGYKDGRYLSYLSMNNAIHKLEGDSSSDINSQYDKTRTPDTSGNNFYGNLVNGAEIPMFTVEEAKTQQFYGQMARFKAGSYIDSDFTSSKLNLKTFSVEMMVKPLIDLNNPNDNYNKYMFLTQIPGVMNIILEENRKLHVTLNSTTDFRTGFIGNSLPVGEWTHVAVTWNEVTSLLQVYVNATKIYERVLASGFKVNNSSGKFYVGPMALGIPGHDLNSMVLAIDEYKISNIVRSGDEFADSAFIPLSRRGLPSLTLASALKSKTLRVMNGHFDLNTAQLGSLLFKDPRLSKNSAVSCATCHDSTKGFSDGLAIKTGLQGTKLSFNSPTLINRALGRNQTLDGKFTSAAEQMWLPITHTNEMGMSVASTVSFLNSNSDYKSRFQNIFGAAPNPSNIQLAMAAFVNSIISGKSKFDRVEAKESGYAYTAAELAGKTLFFGKARCAGCHSGPNFTDDQFHNTGIFNSGSFGLASISGRTEDNRKIKTPTLRHLSMTGPYFHDGSVTTLAEVINRYIGAANDKADQTKDSEMRPFSLNDTEKNQLLSFLGTLESSITYAFNLNLSEPLPGTATVPTAPVIGSASAGNAQATVSFSAPSSNGGSAITAYEIYANGSSTAIKTGTSSPLVVTGLTNGTAYTFKVKARNAVGLSAISAASNSVTPSSATVPTAPVIGSASAGNAQATVSFSAPSSNGGSAITGYEIYANGSSTAIKTGTSSPLVVTGLTNGTAYTFKVKARNAIGLSPISAASNSVTPKTVPSAPVIGSASAGNAQATVSFSAPSSNGGSAITAYEIYANGSSTVIKSGTSSPLVVTGLTNGTAYTFKVKARNAVGLSALSAASNSVTPKTVPTAPVIGTASAGNAQATVSFSAPSSNGGSAITAYEIYANGSSTVIKSGTSSPLVVTGLTNGTAYTFKVKARNAVGLSAISAASNSVIPVPPVIAPTINYSLSSLNLYHYQTMTTITPSRSGSPITSCQSSPTLPAGLSLNQTTCAISGTPSAISSLATYRITARNAGGNSAAVSLSIAVLRVDSLTFSAGQLSLSANSRKTASNFYLVYQSDGNLVLYTSAGVPRWASNTVQSISTNRVAAFQGDGNLVLYNNSQPYWASSTIGSNYKLVVQDTAPYLRILNASGGIVWSSSGVGSYSLQKTSSAVTTNPNLRAPASVDSQPRQFYPKKIKRNFAF